jgi:hypothetical protein
VGRDPTPGGPDRTPGEDVLPAGDLIIDAFAHSGTVNRVCQRLGLDCIGIDLSPFYCRKIAEETGAEYVDATARGWPFGD